MNSLSTPKMIFFDVHAHKDDSQKYITENDSSIIIMSNGNGHEVPMSVMGPRIRELREGMGFSQQDLSQAVWDMIGRDHKKGTQSHISNLENSSGDKLPSVQVLRALAVILETSTDYLLGLTDDPSQRGDLDDQVVVTVVDPVERTMLQEAVELLAGASSGDKEYIVSLIRRLAPKKPRIIGDE